MWIVRSRRSDNGNVAQDRAMARRIASDKKASSPHLFAIASLSRRSPLFLVPFSSIRERLEQDTF